MVDFNAADGTQSFTRTFGNQLSEGQRKGKYMLFDRPGPLTIMNSAGAIPALMTAAQGQIDTILVPGAFGNNMLELFQTTAQTLAPIYNAKGILIGGDVVDNESVEYVPGGNRAENPFAYVAGTDPGVFIRATLEITDSSGSDQMCLGFRKQEAYAVPVSFLTTGDALYTDFAGIGFSGTAAANLVKSMTDIGNLGSTTVFSTGFTWADTKIHQLEVRISKRQVQYLINGSRPGERITKDGIGGALATQTPLVPPAYTFTAGLNLIPFFFHRYDATTPGAVYLRRLEVGQLLEVGLQPEGRGPQAG